MAQGYHNSSYRKARPVRARKGAGRRLALIAFMGVVAFTAGFVLLWTLGSWIVGGRGLGGGSGGEQAAAAAVASAQTDYKIEPLVDMLAFRDLSYVPVKGIYVTDYVAGSEQRLPEMIGIADRTEINAFVINVKNDYGYVSYETSAPMAQQYGVTDNIIKDIDGVLATLAEHDIIPIARIVCFKDAVLPKERPDLGIQSTDGGLWTDNSKAKSTYLNPYNHEVWEYLVQVAEDAARRGFREIQFDYVRFPTDGDVAKTDYPGEYCTKDDAIAGFLAYARTRLEKLGVWLSADVFGLVLAHPTNAFGQQLEKMCRSVDILSPMPYPSHYNTGSYGVADPNSDPYAIITGAMKDAASRMAGTGAECRPWLQDFWYTADQVKLEIKAAEEQGFNEWILWNASNNYTEAALRPQ
jgi:hypothetical protein